MSRGAPAAAAELFERAVRLTPPGRPAEAARRRTDAAPCAFQSGDSRRARELLDEVLRTTPRGAARGRALVRLALVRGYDDDLRAAEALLREAIENADGDAELTAEAHLQLAGMLFRLRERLREAVEHGTSADAPSGSTSRPRRSAPGCWPRRPSATRARRRRCSGCWSSTHAAVMRRVIARPLFQAAFTWLWWDELERARTAFETLHAQAAELGDESSLAYMLVMGAQIDCVLGDVPGAVRHADEGYALTEQTGQATVGAYVLALRALADAIAGELDQGRERAGARSPARPARTAGPPSTSPAPRSASSSCRPAGPPRRSRRSGRWSPSCAPSRSPSPAPRASCPTTSRR